MIPRWFRRLRPVREVTITLELDTSRFEAELRRVCVNFDDRDAIVRHRRRIAHERSLAQAHLGVQLDRWCLSYGWDPVVVWRAPREQEAQDRRDRARLQVAWRAGVMSPPNVIKDVTS